MAASKPGNKHRRKAKAEAWPKRWRNTKRELAVAASGSCISVASSCLDGRLVLLLLLDLEEERAVNVRQHTTKGDCGADQGIELLVATNGKLQMAGRDALDLEVLCGVLRKKTSVRRSSGCVFARTCMRMRKETYACQFKNFRSQVLENGRHVHRRLGANAHLVLSVGLEEALNTATGELGRESVIAYT